MIIRYAKKSDFDFLVEGLEKNRAIEKRPTKDIKAKKSDFLEFKKAIKGRSIRIAELEERPIAFLYFRTDFKVMYLYGKFFWVDLIYVGEKHRGRGIGRMLYDDAFKIARSKGFRTIVIDVFGANRDSVGFHKKLKFEPVYTIYRKNL